MVIMKQSSTLAVVFILLIAAEFRIFYRFSEGAKRRIQIADDLDDVVDDEEDEAWRQWGKSKPTKPDFDPPPDDFSKMDVSEMQAEMLKRQSGPVFGFVKLRLGSRRTPEMISEIAMKWTNVARTGGIRAQFMGVDVSTIMFTMERGQDTIELKEFILSQTDAYEIKIGEQYFRRPGNPPFDQVFDNHQNEKGRVDHGSSREDDKHNEL